MRTLTNFWNVKCTLKSLTSIYWLCIIYPFKLNIVQKITELKRQRNERLQIEADDVIRELARIAFASAADLHIDWDKLKDWNDLTADQKSIIAEIKIKNRSGGSFDNPWTEREQHVKMFDKLRALESLAKHVGLYEHDNRQKQVPIINFIEVDSNPRREENDDFKP